MDKSLDSKRTSVNDSNFMNQLQQKPLDSQNKTQKLDHQFQAKTKNANDKDNKKNLLNTDTLDHAMQELLDICKLYSDKLSEEQGKDNNILRQHEDVAKNNSKMNPTNSSPNPMKTVPKNNGPPNQNHSMSNNCDNQIDNNRKALANDGNDGSIERLQEKQGELQSRLDEALQISRKLGSKQNRKLKSIFEEGEDSNISASTQIDQEDDEDEELIEFQKIENELRISELNRQLDNIQEELRIRLYKRLMSNTNNGSKSVNNTRANQQRPGSSTDESSPSSSSCSDDPLTTISVSSSISNTTTDTQVTKINATFEGKMRQPEVFQGFDQPDAAKPDENHEIPQLLEIRSQKKKAEELLDTTKQTIRKENSPATKGHQTTCGLDSIAESSIAEFVASQPPIASDDPSRCTTESSRDSFGSSMGHSNEVVTPFTSHCQMPFTTFNASNQHNSIASLRNSSVNKDLERIEEDEEDYYHEYYGNSDIFRTIYEEKLSPIMQGSLEASRVKEFYSSQNQRSSIGQDFQTTNRQVSQNINLADGLQITSANCQLAAMRYNPADDTGLSSGGSSGGANNTANSFSCTPDTTKSTSSQSHYDDTLTRSRLVTDCTNRPLTLYLPKPDEQIDLLDHVQTLGHDLSLISADLRLDSNSAQGYLWKCCSNNRKKWLKRYFYFDRGSRMLFYYENEAHLVKRKSSPRASIGFNEINDVYVDHKLSGIGEKDRSSKRKKYVFVLATLSRNYLLASSKAETMRAWIDILFTAAEANDYFQRLATGEIDEAFKGQA